MQLEPTRTTIRLSPPLKKAAQKKAVELDISFQTLLSKALQRYLEYEAKKEAKKIVFRSKDIGVPLDNLTREDIYAD
ncbi:MAG: hypothetical protein WDZ94_04245 [Patescibacteria group bacterium]